MWLYQFQARIQEQNESFLALARSVEQIGEGQRIAIDTLVEKIGGDKPVEFLERYNKAARERDLARRQLDLQRSISDRLAVQAQDLEKQSNDQNEKLAAVRKEAPTGSKATPRMRREMRDRLAILEESHERDQKKLEELAPFLESKDGKAVLELQHELSRTRTLAYLGWGLTAVLGLAMISAYLYYKPSIEALPVEEPQPGEGELPTHRIV